MADQRANEENDDLKEENRTLQQRLHEENQRRFVTIEKTLERQDGVLEQIAENTKDLPKMKDRLDTIESEHNKAKGAIKLVLAVATSGGLAELGRAVFGRH